MKSERVLYCFPYAGGNISFFGNLKEELEPEIKVIGIEYPGHGKRFKEKLPDTWEELLTDVLNQIGNIDDIQNVSFLGYSMGSLVATELLQRDLIQKKIEHVFAISHNAPHMTNVEGVWSNGSDLEIVERMKCLGGFERVDEKILASKYFQTMHMNPLKTDYKLLQMYTREGVLKKEMNATVIYSPLDTSVDHVSEWQKYFSKVDFYQMGGSHFILKDYFKEIAAIIKEKFV